MTNRVYVENFSEVGSQDTFNYVSLVPDSHVAYKKQGCYAETVKLKCDADKMGGRGSSPYQEKDLTTIGNVLSQL